LLAAVAAASALTLAAASAIALSAAALAAASAAALSAAALAIAASAFWQAASHLGSGSGTGFGFGFGFGITVLAAAVIEIVKVVEATKPFASVTCTVTAEEAAAVGVPEMVPVFTSKVKPACSYCKCVWLCASSDC
jgi:hypothetical protein